VARRHPEVGAIVTRVGVTRQHQRDLRHRLLPHRALLGWRVPEALELHARRRLAGAELDPPAGDQVEHRDALRDPGGMVVARRHEHDAVPEADATRACGARREEHLGRRGVRVLLEEVVLPLPGVVDAQPVGELDLLERVVNQALLVVGLPRPWQLVLVEDPELHRATGAGGARRVKARRVFSLRLTPPGRAVYWTDRRGPMVETHRSFCRFCHAVCGIEVDVEDGRVLAVRGDRAHVVPQGYLCVKGGELPEQPPPPWRLRGAKRRTADGTFVDIASETAMDEVAMRLSALIARDGPSAIAVYSGTHGLFGSAKPLIIAWANAIGTHWYFTPNTIDQPSQQTAWARHGGWDAGVQRFADADVMLFVGNNPGVSAFSRDGGPPYANAFKYLRDARRRGMKIIAIDPRRTELARSADLPLQVRPGEDPTLLAGMVRVILEEGLHDREFVAAHVEGVHTLRAAGGDSTPGYGAGRTEVPAAQMIAAARLFAAGPRGTAMTCTGVNMAPRPDVTQHLVLALNSLCGRFAREGDVVRNPGVLKPPRAFRAEVQPPRDLWGKGPWSRLRGLGRFGI